MTASPFADLTDDALRTMLQSLGNACVGIVQGTPEEQNRVGKKGEASPLQAGTLTLAGLLQVATELELRGFDTGIRDVLEAEGML